EAIGIRLAGTVGSPAAADTALVDDNFIGQTSSSHNAGIVVQTTNAVIAFNSVHGPSCTTNCSSAFATGVYAMLLTSANDVRVLANTFSAPEATYGDATATPAIIEHDNIVTTIALDAVIDNVFGWDTSVESPVLLVTFIATDTNLDSPRG